MENNAENKSFFHALTRSNAFWAVISLILAVFLWMYVTSTEGVEVSETFSNVPIEFLGEDTLRESSGLVVTKQDRTTVNLTLSGARRVINKLSSDNISATINLNKMYTDGR